MKGYKGFDADLKCRDFQYEIGKTYEREEAELCKSGFHFCEAPLDVFSYYPPSVDGKLSRYCEVEAEDVSDEKDDDSKRVSKKLSVGAEIGIPGLVKAHIEYVKERTEKGITNTGYLSVATNTGNLSVASNTGDLSVATNTGYRSVASNTGNQSASMVEGKDSVAMACGYQSKAKACIGSAIVIAERGEWDGITYPLVAIKAAIIDGKTMKPDTWYTLKDGEFVELDG